MTTKEHAPCPDGLSCSGDGSDCVGDRRCIVQPPIDVEALKREVCETVTHNIQKVGAVYAVNVVSDIIDHLASAGYFRAHLPKIEGLNRALDGAEYTENSDGLYGIFTFLETDANVILQAARAYLALQGGE